jgi:hypothetical protein
MNGERPKQDPIPADVPADVPAEGENAVQHSGNGAQTAFEAMLRKRLMRAGSEPQPPRPDGGQRKK